MRGSLTTSLMVPVQEMSFATAIFPARAAVMIKKMGCLTLWTHMGITSQLRRPRLPAVLTHRPKMMIPFSPISNGTKPHGRPFGQAWAKRNETAPMLALEDARTALVDLVEFCIPTTGTKVPSGPGWLHEIKQDGFRLRVERDGDLVDRDRATLP